MNASDIPTIQALLQNRAQLKSRATQVANAQDLQTMLGLMAGTAIEPQVLTLAKQTVGAFFTNAIGTVEAQITGLGVTLDV